MDGLEDKLAYPFGDLAYSQGRTVINRRYTPPKLTKALENRPSQKDTSIHSNHPFSGANMLVSRRV